MSEGAIQPSNGVDPNVKVPEAVARAAAAAEAFYKQPEPPVSAPAETSAPAEITATVNPPEPPAPAPAPVDPPPQPPLEAQRPSPPPTDEKGWEHRYHSMRGRYDQAMTTIQGMQEQLRAMGQELVAAQQALANLGRQPVTGQQQSTQKLVTDKDREVYGDELLDVVKRAALETVAPELESVKAENQRLKAQNEAAAKRNLYAALDSQVPNWRDINRNPRFSQWLSLTDLLAGSGRRALLNAAFQAADAPRVVAFFKSFISDEAATGSTEFAPQPNVQAAPAPRTPPLALEALAAPGRAKPVGTDTRPAGNEKPIFTRAQIRQFYDDCRKQLYAGREAERQATEKAIFAAQKEGRVR